MVTLEKVMVVSYKMKHISTQQSNDFIPLCLSKGNESMWPQKKDHYRRMFTTALFSIAKN